MGKFLKRLKGLQNGANVVGGVVNSKVSDRFNRNNNPNNQRYNINKKTKIS